MRVCINRSSFKHRDRRMAANRGNFGEIMRIYFAFPKSNRFYDRFTVLHRTFWSRKRRAAIIISSIVDRPDPMPILCGGYSIPAALSLFLSRAISVE